VPGGNLKGEIDMRKTILTCDRCKLKVDELIEVGAGRRSRSYGLSYAGSGTTMEVVQLTAEWCFDCCIKMHITRPHATSAAIPLETPPTIEDMIREIIREEVRE